MKDSNFPDELRDELAKEIDIKNILHGTDFSDAKEWFIKSGMKIEEAKKELTKKIIEILSQYLSKGLVQLTIEEIANEKESKDAIQGKKDNVLVMHLSKDLPPFNIYVEFLIKSGEIEISKIRYDFTIESNIEIKDTKLIIQKNKISSISFGSFSVSITLYLLNNEQRIELGTIEKSLSLGKLDSKSINT
jgi:hypothetical protein